MSGNTATCMTLDSYFDDNDPINRIVRVYPFAIQIPFDAINKLELRGTEHDQWN